MLGHSALVLFVANLGCPADLLISQAVLDPKVHGHTTRAGAPVCPSRAQRHSPSPVRGWPRRRSPSPPAPTAPRPAQPQPTLGRHLPLPILAPFPSFDCCCLLCHLISITSSVIALGPSAAPCAANPRRNVGDCVGWAGPMGGAALILQPRTKGTR
jgi:hypothetical protein